MGWLRDQKPLHLSDVTSWQSLASGLLSLMLPCSLVVLPLCTFHSSCRFLPHWPAQGLTEAYQMLHVLPAPSFHCALKTPITWALLATWHSYFSSYHKCLNSMTWFGTVPDTQGTWNFLSKKEVDWDFYDKEKSPKYTKLGRDRIVE